jgi:hypothetical protein
MKIAPDFQKSFDDKSNDIKPDTRLFQVVSDGTNGQRQQNPTFR